MTGPVYGEGFIIIRPDFSRFDSELRHGVNRLLDDLADDFRLFERFVESVFEDLADEIIFQMRYVDRVLNRIFNQIARDARECGYIIAASFTLASQIARHELDELEERARRAFRNIRQASNGSAMSIFSIFRGLGMRLMSMFTSLFSAGGSAGGSAATSTSSIGSSLMGSLSSISGLVTSAGAMAIIIPLALELVGVLINLAGALFALPAAAGIAVAAFAPLIIAFKGVGEALSAIWEGDPKKIAEALKGLAPHARAVVKEFTQFVEPLKKIGKDIQQGFFVPLEGAITNLGNTVLPILSNGINKVGWVWGESVRMMLDAFSTPEFASALGGIIETTINIVKRFGPTMGKFATAFIGLISKGLPYVERFAFWIASLVDKFSEWISKSTQSGQVTGWLDQAWQAGKKLYEVIKQISIFAGLMFGSFGDEGQDTLGGMAEQIAKVNEYLRSEDGQKALHNLGVIIHWVGNAIVWMMGQVTSAYDGLNFLFDMVRSGIHIVSDLVNKWINGWKDLWSSTKEMWNNITGAVKDAWNATISWLGSTWTSVKKFFVDGWHSLTSTVSTWATNTKNAIMSFPATVKQYLIDSIHNAAYNFGYAVGTILRFILDLPGKAMNAFRTLKDGVLSSVAAVKNFIFETIPEMSTKVDMWFTEMWNKAWAATTNFVSNAITTIGELPERVGNYITETKNRTIARFTEMKDTAVERVRGLVSSARDEASKLPGQVSNAISSVISKTYDIGRDMIYGMINGIKNAAHALWNAARSVVMDAWQGAKDALQSKSPSKKWAELGHDSAAGYQVGFDHYDLTDSIASSIKMPLDAFARSNARPAQASTNVNVGGASVVAYLQIGDDQLRPVVVTTIKEHPQEVSLAAQQGDSQLARRR